MTITVLVVTIVGGLVSTSASYRLTRAFGPNAPYASYLQSALCPGANLPPIDVPIQAGFPFPSHGIKKNLPDNCSPPADAIGLADFVATPEFYGNLLFWLVAWAAASAGAAWLMWFKQKR